MEDAWAGTRSMPRPSARRMRRVMDRPEMLRAGFVGVPGPQRLCRYRRGP